MTKKEMNDEIQKLKDKIKFLEDNKLNAVRRLRIESYNTGISINETNKDNRELTFYFDNPVKIIPSASNSFRVQIDE